MVITTSRRAPVVLAYTAALLFTLASGGTNFIYGWSKGTDLPSSIIWSAVSVAVSIVFPTPRLVAITEDAQPVSDST